MTAPTFGAPPAPNPLNAAAAAFVAALARATGTDPITFPDPAGGTWELRRIDVERLDPTVPTMRAQTEGDRHTGARPKRDRVDRYVGADDHPK
jgi:hypothetical protein